MATGQVPVAAARLVARAWTALPSRCRDTPTAQALITVAGGVDLAELTGKVDELIAALLPELIDADHADAHDARDLSLIDVGAHTAVRGTLDALDGEELRGILLARVEQDRGGPEDTRSSGQRLIDALLDLARAAHDGGLLPDGTNPPGLVVIAPTDALLGQPATQQPSLLDPPPPARPVADTDATPPSDLHADAHSGSDSDSGDDSGDDSAAAGLLTGLPATAHTRRGTRIGPRTLQRLCCDATLTRLLLDPAGHPLDSNPSRRQLTSRERRALEHRDGYRCQRRGCRRPAASCTPHHVVPWHLGGPTIQANMLLLCRACHHQLHDRDTHLPLHDGRIIGPRGWIRGPEPPPRPLL